MGQIGISKLDLKRQNRMQILKLLKKKGPLSRIDIANQLELTRAAVTIITNEMIEQDIISEVGEYKAENSKACRGRKKILIDINQNYKFVLGITIESENISIGLSTLNGAVLDKVNKNTSEFRYIDDIYDFINVSFNKLLENNCLLENKILGIGIGIMPNMYSPLNIVYDSKATDYSNVIKNMRKFTQMPISIDNCVKGTSMANIDFQKDRDPNRENIGFLSYGNLFNFTITNLNEPVYSYNNRTNYINNIIINPFTNFSPQNNLIKGSAVAELNPQSIVEKIKNIYGEETTPILYSLSNGEFNQVTYEMCHKAADSGDYKVSYELDKIMNLLAILINNIIYATNPQKLVLHDFNFSEKHLQELKDKVAFVSNRKIAEKINLSIINKTNRFLGGAAIAIRELFYTTGGIS